MNFTTPLCFCLLKNDNNKTFRYLFFKLMEFPVSSSLTFLYTLMLARPNKNVMINKDFFD